MSIFDQQGAGQSSEAELAALIKAEPDLAETKPVEEPAPQPLAEPPAQASETAATDTPVAEGQQQPPPAEEAQKPPKTVPAAALAEAREKARDWEQKFHQLQGQLQAWQQMQQQGQGQPQPPAQPQPGQQQEEPPDPEQDPIGALRWERQQRENLQRFMQGQAVQQRVQEAHLADAQQFAAQTPDFGAAYRHLLTGRVTELRHLGYTDQQIAQQVRQEEFGVALNALRAGKSSGQALYELAKARGYAPAPPPAAPPAKPAAPDPALQEARQKAAASISDGGAAPKSEMTLDYIINNLHGAAQESALQAYEAKHLKKSSIFDEQRGRRK